MKTLITTCIAVVGLNCSALAQVVMVNFSSTNSTSPSAPGAEWNNITNFTTATSDVALIDYTTGLDTGFSLSITDSFKDIGGQSFAAYGNFTSQSLSSYFYGDSADPNAAIEITGLDPNTKYTFDLVAARDTTTNRTTEYTLTGDSVTIVTNAAGTPFSTANIATASAISPDATGKITIDIKVASDSSSSFFYLNAMQITAIPEPSTYALAVGALGLGMVMLLKRRK
ncbi:PEP-CTERM sorting domain-containing protein [Cerasicoccus fimbriatus]|uniref:PEP-CTERM sorting domain-containing protein n=1 Tax=Cerasicoccus fimbriatus TaxID=3014554 RepID=UPI0022B46592|nr:PEP-CTERM sorting domain-containing protein [Cerasicoccus sp. TK19100]